MHGVSTCITTTICQLNGLECDSKLLTRESTRLQLFHVITKDKFHKHAPLSKVALSWFVLT